MRKTRSDGLETRQRLLAAACEIFAEKGFWEATTSDICKKANANTAAINYHFGSKESLYVESWRSAFKKSVAAYPPDGGVSLRASAEEKLRGRITSIMRRIIDAESYEFDIIHKEMANPTGLLTEVIQKSVEPIHKGLASVVRELLGDGANEQQARLCQMSIMSQCLGPLLRQRRRKQSPHALNISGNNIFIEDVEALAEHVVRFSMAGIRDMRQQIESNSSKKVVQN